jgi:hypothetical protein
LVLLLALIAAFSVGCQKVVALPPQAQVAEIEASGHAAKGPGCNMPILRSEPLTDFRKVAIVEGLGNVYAEEKDVMPVVLRAACETGADAIVINASKAQTSENMTGYYINAVAIVYVHKDHTIKSTQSSAP